MSRLNMAELVEMVAINRYPIHRRFHFQFEHEFYILPAAVKHTYKKHCNFAIVAPINNSNKSSTVIWEEHVTAPHGIAIPKDGSDQGPKCLGPKWSHIHHCHGDIARTEILSTVHGQVKYISVKKYAIQTNGNKHPQTSHSPWSM